MGQMWVEIMYPAEVVRDPMERLSSWAEETHPEEAQRIQLATPDIHRSIPEGENIRDESYVFDSYSRARECYKGVCREILSGRLANLKENAQGRFQVTLSQFVNKGQGYFRPILCIRGQFGEESSGASVPEPVPKSLACLLDHFKGELKREQQDYEKNGCPKGHIFEHAEVVRDWIDTATK